MIEVCHYFLSAPVRRAFEEDDAIGDGLLPLNPSSSDNNAQQSDDVWGIFSENIRQIWYASNTPSRTKEDLFIVAYRYSDFRTHTVKDFVSSYNDKFIMFRVGMFEYLITQSKIRQRGSTVIQKVRDCFERSNDGSSLSRDCFFKMVTFRELGVLTLGTIAPSYFFYEEESGDAGSDIPLARYFTRDQKEPKYQQFMLRKFADRYLITAEDELHAVYSALPLKERAALIKKDSGYNGAMKVRGFDISVTDILENTKNSRLLFLENRVVEHLKEACSLAKNRISMWRKSTKNGVVLQDIVNDMYSRALLSHPPANLFRALSHDIGVVSLVCFFVRNQIDPCMFLFDVFTSYIGEGRVRNMLLAGPIQTGKTTIMTAFRKLLPGAKAIDLNPSFDKFGFSELGFARFLIFEDCTSDGMKNIDKYYRAALDGVAVRVDVKYKSAEEMACPPTFITTNLDLAFIPIQVQSRTKIYNFRHRITSREAKLFADGQTFQNFVMFCLSGELALSWMSGEAPTREYDVILTIFQPKDENGDVIEFYDPTVSMLHAMAASPPEGYPSYLFKGICSLLQTEGIRAKGRAMTKGIFSRRLLHIPSVLPGLQLIASCMPDPVKGKKYNHLKRWIDSEGSRLVKVRHKVLATQESISKFRGAEQSVTYVDPRFLAFASYELHHDGVLVDEDDDAAVAALCVNEGEEETQVEIEVLEIERNGNRVVFDSIDASSIPTLSQPHEHRSRNLERNVFAEVDLENYADYDFNGPDGCYRSLDPSGMEVFAGDAFFTPPPIQRFNEAELREHDREYFEHRRVEGVPLFANERLDKDGEVVVFAADVGHIIDPELE